MTPSYHKVPTPAIAIALLLVVLAPSASAQEIDPRLIDDDLDDAPLPDGIEGPPSPLHGQIVIVVIVAGQTHCVLIVSLDPLKLHTC
ncbi:MAG TPA: hypothetical protein VHH36_06215 [Candidatus Thermoplasmatota archaeon]|nr:hypothetical protein [Candidatus Thermoplasmatota archaeon]